jgi:hypothetical protein
MKFLLILTILISCQRKKEITVVEQRVVQAASKEKETTKGTNLELQEVKEAGASSLDRQEEVTKMNQEFLEIFNTEDQFTIKENQQRFEGAQKLLDQGADINFKDQFGYYALIQAIFYRNIPAIVFLQENGADMNIPSKAYNNRSAQEVAIEDGHQDIQLLFR